MVCSLGLTAYLGGMGIQINTFGFLIIRKCYNMFPYSWKNSGFSSEWLFLFILKSTFAGGLVKLWCSLCIHWSAWGFLLLKGTV